MLNFFKKYWSAFIIFMVIVVVGGVFVMRVRENDPQYETVAVARADLVEIVSVTGKVKAESALDLAFVTGGKVASVSAAVGGRVKAGEVLMRLESGELVADFKRALADVEGARARLLQAEAARRAAAADFAALQRGTRAEEIRIAEVAVENAERALDDARAEEDQTRVKADSDLVEDHRAALVAGEKSVTVAVNALLTLTGIQYTHFIVADQESGRVAAAKAAAVRLLLGGGNGDYWTKESIQSAWGGARQLIGEATADPPSENTTAALAALRGALDAARAALESVPITRLTSAELTDVTNEKTAINNERITLASKLEAIALQEQVNDSAILAAQMKVTGAENMLRAAEEELALKRAPATPEESARAQARVEEAAATEALQAAAVKQAQAAVARIQAQLGNTILRAPVDGVITRRDVQAGEIAPPNAVVASLLGDAPFTLEAEVPEADIAVVKVGDGAHVTLDAYGETVQFPARVILIDPGETIVEGVTTYKVTLDFEGGVSRVKPSMTANIDIVTGTRTGVLAIPRRALVVKDGKRIVRRLIADGVIETVVETGLVGRNGMIEITNGINEGDEIVVSIEEKE